MNRVKVTPTVSHTSSNFGALMVRVSASGKSTTDFCVDGRENAGVVGTKAVADPKKMMDAAMENLIAAR